MISLINQLFRRGPRNIKKKLIRDILIIVFITAAATLFFSIGRDNQIKEEITSQLIGETSRLVNKRFINFLTPYDTSIRLLSSIIEEIPESPLGSSEVETILAKALRVHPDLHHVAIVYEDRSSLRLTREADGFDVQSTPDDSNLEEQVSELLNSEEAQHEDQDVTWSETFSTVGQKPGFTARVVGASSETGTRFVLSYFIPAERIIMFISDIEIENDIDIVLFNSRGLIISRQWLDSSQQPSGEATGASALLASPTTGEIVNHWLTHNPVADEYRKVVIGGTTWWAGVTRLSEQTFSPWIAIVVPEKSILLDAQRQWKYWWAVFGGIVLCALAMTLFVVWKYSFLLKDISQNALVSSDLQKSVARLVAAGESATLEFKSTMRHNLKSGKHGKEIELAWLKGVAAFLNSDGGILLIGVNDDGQVVGIEPDEFKNDDKCRLHFRNLVNTHIGPNFARYIHLRMTIIEDKTVLVIECERVRSPVFLRVGKSEDFFVRSGPSNMKLSMSQMVDYLAAR